ncbi:Flp family type IVb pilin [Sphingorhabdus sp.]|uniref:Flp family type IVb pilin n=1 Tax=Sphingorhabdus sp. TaxID=1902408 RepID=UPI0039834FF2
MLELIRRIEKCEQGATAVEYGLIVSLIVLAMLSSLSSVATSTTQTWNDVTTKVTSSTS